MSRARPFVVSLALRSYPSWWRDRYGNDAASTTDDLLAAGRSSLVLAGGCFVGALNERLRGPGGSSSPIDARHRLELSVIGTHGAWMLAFPFALLTEVILLEQTAFGGLRGSVRRPLPVPFGLQQVALLSGVIAAVILAASVQMASRRARRTGDRSTARLAALPLKTALFSATALLLLVVVPRAFDHWEWGALPNLDPAFLFGYGLDRGKIYDGAVSGTGVAVLLLVLTWAVIIAGTAVAIWSFSTAVRRIQMTSRSSAVGALLGSLATVALAVNWVSLLGWAVVVSSASRVPTDYGAPPGVSDLVFVLLALMLLPLVAGLRSSARSLRARHDLRRA